MATLLATPDDVVGSTAGGEHFRPRLPLGGLVGKLGLLGELGAVSDAPSFPGMTAGRMREATGQPSQDAAVRSV